MEKYLNLDGLHRVLIDLKFQIAKSKNSILDQKGKANGVATLDSNGFVPIAQLGNLDTSLFLIVQKLPTSLDEIKINHIYIIPNNKDTEDLNKYSEYIYTGTTDTEFEQLRWEKLGDFSPEVDLQDYAMADEAASSFKTAYDTDGNLKVVYTMADGTEKEFPIPIASATLNGWDWDLDASTLRSKPMPTYWDLRNGLMSGSDKKTLDDINSKFTSLLKNGIALSDDANYSSLSVLSLEFGLNNSSVEKTIINSSGVTSNVINTSRVCHDTNETSASEGHDIIIGNTFSDDGFVKIDSTHTGKEGTTKNGNIYIQSPSSGTIHIDNGSSVYGGHISISNGLVDISQSADGSSSSNVEITTGNIQLTLYDSYSIEGTNYYNGTNINISKDQFSINNYKESQAEKYFYINHSGDLTNDPIVDEDKIQFFTDETGELEIPLLIKKNEIKCWGDLIKATKGKDVRLKTSSSNSVRLTEGEGFKVFANLFADPDHATDLSEFTDEEKNMLKNNSVQKLLIMILKKLNLIDVTNPNY